MTLTWVIPIESKAVFLAIHFARYAMNEFFESTVKVMHDIYCFAFEGKFAPCYFFGISAIQKDLVLKK
jgi:hypothetical protein